MRRPSHAIKDARETLKTAFRCGRVASHGFRVKRREGCCPSPLPQAAALLATARRVSFASS